MAEPLLVDDNAIVGGSHCLICTEACTDDNAVSFVECDDGCAINHPYHFSCIMWWIKGQAAAGNPAKCPHCRTVVTRFRSAALSIDAVMRADHHGAGASAGAGAADALGLDTTAEAGAGPGTDGSGGGDGAEYSIGYVAGVRVVGINKMEWKVVWDASVPLERDEERWSWVPLDPVVENGSLVNDFLVRWNLISLGRDLPVGFEWHHPVPRRVKSGAKKGQWKCTFEGCKYVTLEESNCRKHAGSKHCKSFWICTECRTSFTTKTNLEKHRKLKHDDAQPVAVEAAPPAPADADVNADVDADIVMAE